MFRMFRCLLSYSKSGRPGKGRAGVFPGPKDPYDVETFLGQTPHLSRLGDVAVHCAACTACCEAQPAGRPRVLGSWVLRFRSLGVDGSGINVQHLFAGSAFEGLLWEVSRVGCILLEEWFHAPCAGPKNILKLRGGSST